MGVSTRTKNPGGHPWATTDPDIPDRKNQAKLLGIPYNTKSLTFSSLSISEGVQSTQTKCIFVFGRKIFLFFFIFFSHSFR
jgi:hypothetical protein